VGIITIDATGPWNLEFFKQMHQELSNIILNDVDYHNFDSTEAAKAWLTTQLT
jgi:hypothetical protein